MALARFTGCGHFSTSKFHFLNTTDYWTQTTGLFKLLNTNKCISSKAHSFKITIGANPDHLVVSFKNFPQYFLQTWKKSNFKVGSLIIFSTRRHVSSHSFVSTDWGTPVFLRTAHSLLLGFEQRRVFDSSDGGIRSTNSQAYHNWSQYKSIKRNLLNIFLWLLVIWEKWENLIGSLKARIKNR